MAKQNLGMVTAYAYAVVGGYEGTEAEFEALLGNIATDLAEIENLTVIANTLPSGSSATASYDHGVLTLGIPKGDKGDTGSGATVTVGTTATGNPGTNASVINSGTTKDAVFNFTIPRGDTGNGIESIELTDTQGAVKTYTILFTDGNTTTFVVTDGEVTNATLTAVLADYAKIDGAYESMTVGNAEQLVSSIFEEDSVPYNFRTSGGSIDIGDRETDMLVGGTVAWNQLVSNVRDGSGGTIVVDGDVTTISAFTARYPYLNSNVFHTVVGHKYLAWADVKYTGTITENIWMYLNNRTTQWGYRAIVPSDPQNTWIRTSEIYVPTVDETTNSFVKFQYNGTDYANLTSISVKNTVCIDLTQMFGSTIADYIYTLESGTAGAGVAWFRKLFPKPYYEYNAGELMSVNASSHDMVGFNQWDEVMEDGTLNWDTGANVSNSSALRSKNYIQCVSDMNYYFKFPNLPSSEFRVCFYDANKNYVGRTSWQKDPFIYKTPANCAYMRFVILKEHYGSTYQNNICINLSWDGERDGEYEAYVKHSYALDSSLTLRGIPKLDANNNLYYDGDTYESDGTVTRRFGVVDLGTLGWVYEPSSTRFYSSVFDNAMKSAQLKTTLLCTRYTENGSPVTGTNVDKTMWLYSNLRLYINDFAYTDAVSFKTAISGVYLVYELATPTTESADPYTNPQIVDDFGTEEYVDYAVSQGDRDVAIPVGHQTQYMANLKAKLEMSPNSPEGAGDYIVRQTNGENEYVTLASNATIQDIIARLEALEGGGE